MRYRFAKAFDYYINDDRRIVIAYPAGYEGTIPHAHAAAADKAGVGAVINAGKPTSGKPAAPGKL